MEWSRRKSARKTRSSTNSTIDLRRGRLGPLLVIVKVRTKSGLANRGSSTPGEWEEKLESELLEIQSSLEQVGEEVTEVEDDVPESGEKSVEEQVSPVELP